MEVPDKVSTSARQKKAAPVGVSFRPLFAILIALVLVVLLGVVSLCVAFSVEIANLRSEIESGINSQAQQQQASDSSILLQLETLSQDLRGADSDNGRRIGDVNASLSQQVKEVQIQADQTVSSLLGSSETFPAPSCANIHPSLPSGHYWLSTSNGSALPVFCDMSLTCGNVTGWALVSQRDYSWDSCPSDFGERMDSNTRTCRPDSAGCTLVDYSTLGITYSSVCGRVVAYQFGTPRAFSALLQTPSLTIDSPYLDGLSLTHGRNPRQHIWSFAAGVADSFTDRSGCPCNAGSTVSVADTFVGADYFCDTAAASTRPNVFLLDDPLWDGAGCRAQSADCCSLNTPPWFYRQLPQPTSDNIEIRACQDEGNTTEGTPIESFEIYVR